MSSDQSFTEIESVVTPRSQRFLSPRSLARKPNLANFIKKKPTEIDDVRSSNRIRFISPGKANLFVPEDSNITQNSLEFNYTQYSSNENINYPFIKRCTSPNIKDHLKISRRSTLRDKGILQDNSFLSTLLEPSIHDFSNCSMISDIAHNNQLQEQVTELKQKNLELNSLIDEKNEHIAKQKQQYDTKIAELTKELLQIKINAEKSEKKIVQNEEKIIMYQTQVKQLQAQLTESNQRFDKAQKEVKMYKAKFRLNYNTKDTQQQENKCKRYHQNCCSRQENLPSKTTKIQENNFIKQNILKDSKKINNNISVELLNSPIKKINSQKNLHAENVSADQPHENVSCLMQVHQNEEYFNEYNQLKQQVQNLVQKIRYKDIEVLTLKKIRCEFEKQKENYEKVKVFNKKLLSRVQFLTKQCNIPAIKKRHSLPLDMTPKKKSGLCSQDFDEQQDESYETLQFELSPERNLPQKRNLDEDRVFGTIKMGILE